MKKCKQGYYYCYTDKKCKRIPLDIVLHLVDIFAKKTEKTLEKIVIIMETVMEMVEW